MRILHVITSINRGGAENHLFLLAGIQKARGKDVAIAFLKGDGYWREGFEGRGIPVFPLNMRFYGDPRPLGLLRKAVAGFRPDLVHAHLEPAEMYARIAIAGWPRRKLPLVVSRHNDCPFAPLPLEKWMARFVDMRCSRTIAISDAVRRYMTSRGAHARESSVTTVRYGIDACEYACADPAKARAFREEVSAGADLVLGTVARLAPQKALHLMLAGYAEYLKSACASSRLVIVGRGPLEEDLKRTAADLGISGSVSWAGYREDIPAVMAAFDVFMLTSVFEGFGLVLLEAMASGKPVIASRASAIPEIVRHGQSGILVDPRNPGEIAEAIREFEHPGTRAAFGSAGRKIAAEDFSLERMEDETARVYGEVLGAVSCGQQAVRGER